MKFDDIELDGVDMFRRSKGHILCARLAVLAKKHTAIVIDHEAAMDIVCHAPHKFYSDSGITYNFAVNSHWATAYGMKIYLSNLLKEGHYMDHNYMALK